MTQTSFPAGIQSFNIAGKARIAQAEQALVTAGFAYTVAIGRKGFSTLAAFAVRVPEGHVFVISL